MVLWSEKNVSAAVVGQKGYCANRKESEQLRDFNEASGNGRLLPSGVRKKELAAQVRRLTCLFGSASSSSRYLYVQLHIQVGLSALQILQSIEGPSFQRVRNYSVCDRSVLKSQILSSAVS